MLLVYGPHERFIVGCGLTRFEDLDVGILADVKEGHLPRNDRGRDGQHKIVVTGTPIVDL